MIKISDYLKILAIALFVVSCSASDDSEAIIINNTTTLAQDIEGLQTENAAVIACAASLQLDSNNVEVYFYAEDGATDFKLYETNSVTVNPQNFENYREIQLNTAPFFNGFLRKFSRPFNSEQYLIVTYVLDNEVKISNPIKTKNVSQATAYLNTINVDQTQSLMPTFSWDVGDANTEIFFQLMSTVDNGVLSGTYTTDNQFQYYNTQNVVLNVTEGTPLNLTPNVNYKFTVMDVSQDNWVNTIYTTIFSAQ